MNSIIQGKVSSLRFEIRLFVAKLFGHVPALVVKRGDGLPLIRLGTDYGGWWLVDDGTLAGATLVSAGLGEDASFDVEFCNAFDANVLLVDPTLRAVKHFGKIQVRFGRDREARYSGRGAEMPEAYNLQHITNERMRLSKKALWYKNENVRFFAPRDPRHVSHSIHNLTNRGNPNAQFLEVEGVTIERLIADYDIKRIDVLKLDIEGAEIEVMRAMLEGKVLPRQVLVEFDELVYASYKSKKRIEGVHRRMLSMGYLLVHRERANCSYYRINSD